MSSKVSPKVSRSLSGSLLLILLLSALLYTRSAWAASNPTDSTDVTVQISPLTLLLQNKVTIKVGDTTCNLVNNGEPLSVCSDLPPGKYEVSASADGYFVTPSSYELDVPENSDENRAASVSAQNDSNNSFFFNLYQNNYQMYMPNVHVGQ